jgi:hypothetical protein
LLRAYVTQWLFDRAILLRFLEGKVRVRADM